MTYKKLFFLLLLLNIIIGSVYIIRKISFNNNINVNKKLVTGTPYTIEEIDKSNSDGIEYYKNLPLDSSNVVMVGTSLTAGLPMDLFTANKIKNRGIPGNYSRHILSRINDIIKAHPKKLFLEVGANDINSKIDSEVLFSNYKRIIEFIKTGSPKTIIYIESILPTTGKYVDNNNRVISFNNKLKAYCKENNIQYIDIYTTLLKDNKLNDSLTIDGIHLNKRGYKVWVKSIDNLAN